MLHIKFLDYNLTSELVYNNKITREDIFQLTKAKKRKFYSNVFF
jgi:hypothetical protein